MRKKLYIAGPYRAATEVGIHANIQNADAVGIELLGKGFTPIVPHKLFAGWGGGAPDDVFLEEGLWQLYHCDAVVVLPGSEKSAGTQREIAYAREANIPVYTYPDLPPV